MRGTWLVAAGVLAGAVALSGCRGQEGQGGSGKAGQEVSYGQKKESKGSEQQLKGNVVQQSGESLVIQVPKKGAVAVQVDPNTFVTLDGKTVAITELPIGSEANATVTGEGKNLKASKIEAKSGYGGGGQAGQEQQGPQQQPSQGGMQQPSEQQPSEQGGMQQPSEQQPSEQGGMQQPSEQQPSQQQPSEQGSQQQPSPRY